MPTAYYSNEFPSLNRVEDQPPGGTQNSVVRIKKATYSMTGLEATNDTIDLFKLPAGSEVMKVGSFVKSVGTIAATCTLDIGDTDDSVTAADTDRYATALDVAAAGLDDFDEDPIYTLGEEATIRVLFKNLSTPTDSGVLHFYVAYRSPE